MSVVGTHLYRRGLDVASYVDDKKVKIELPTWTVFMLGLTFLLFIWMDIMIEYTFGKVIPTLIMIESAHDNIDFAPLATEDTDDSIVKDPEQVTRPTTQYITASFRRSFQLLKSEGGRFRGFSLYLVNKMAIAFVSVWLAGWVGFLPTPFYAVLASVACAQLSLGWTFIVISKPSPKYWFRRLPSARLWKKVAVPTAIHAIATQIATFVPLYLADGLGLEQNPNKIINLPASRAHANAAGNIGLLALSLLLSLFLIVPATVALTRVQASLLSDAEETIVPFDRTFNGKVVPEIVGGSGMVGILDAWTTFDWAARIRLIKAYAKTVAMVFGLTIFFAGLFITQLVLGVDWNKAIVPDDGKL